MVFSEDYAVYKLICIYLDPGEYLIDLDFREVKEYVSC